jgi:hypothetical protein
VLVLRVKNTTTTTAQHQYARTIGTYIGTTNITTMTVMMTALEWHDTVGTTQHIIYLRRRCRSIARVLHDGA